MRSLFSTVVAPERLHPAQCWKDPLLWSSWLLAAFYLFINLGTGSLSIWDESVYARVSQEIMKNDNWIVPHMDGHHWLEKPPLYMWFTAGLYHVFGFSEFTTRFTSAFLGANTVALLYIMGRSLFNRTAGFVAALTLLATPHYFHFSKQGMLDVSLTFFIALMVYFFWLGIEKRKYLFLSGTIFLFAYLVKGHAAFMGLAILLLFALWSRNEKMFLDKSFVCGLGLSIAIIIIFHLMQISHTGAVFFKSFIDTHILKRTFSTLDYHQGGMDFYFHAIKNKGKPWSVMALISLLYTVFAAFKPRHNAEKLIVSWVMAVFICTMVVKTKLHWYILPIYPAMALSLGLAVSAIARKKNYWKVVIVILLLLGLLLQVKLSKYFNLDFNSSRKEGVEVAKSLLHGGEFVYAYKLDFDGKVYAEGHIVELLQANKHSDALGNGPIYVLTDVNQLDELKKKYDVDSKVFFQKEKTVILRFEKALPKVIPSWNEKSDEEAHFTSGIK